MYGIAGWGWLPTDRKPDEPKTLSSTRLKFYKMNDGKYWSSKDLFEDERNQSLAYKTIKTRLAKGERDIQRIFERRNAF
jgi:hypothetical protein